MKFSQYLEMKFLEWQSKEGGRKTVKEFAGFIGVSQSTISSWWNGIRVPEGENIQKIAIKLGIEVYDVLGIQRPDPRSKQPTPQPPRPHRTGPHHPRPPPHLGQQFSLILGQVMAVTVLM